MTPQVISLSSLGSTAWIPVDYKQNPFNIGLACVVSNTPNLTYQVEFTLDDIFNTSITPTAFAHSLLVGKTSDFSSNQTIPVRAIRLTTTAYTSGTVTLTALQGGVNPIIYTPNPVTLYQSGIPFVLFPGDGGSNGLSFSGTRGVFSLSAAPLTGISNMLASGGYAYFPAGAGGLAEGWYLFKLTSDTAGEVYANTYVLGSGEPVIPDSPTALANLTAGRITQSTSEITAVQVPVSATMFGKNDLIRVLGAIRATNSAGQKSLRFKMDTHVVGSILSTTSNNVVDAEFIRQNAGVLTRQLGSRTGTGWVGFAQTSLSQDHSTLNAATAFNINMTLQLAVTTDFILGMARSINIISRRS